jgi:O-antigen ligase
LGSFDPRKVIRLLSIIVLLLSALYAGSINRLSLDITLFASFIMLVLALAGKGLQPPARVWPLLLPAAMAFLSCLWTINLNNSLDQSFTLAGFAALAWAVSYVSAESRRSMLSTVLAGAGIVAVYGIYQYYIGFARTEDFIKSCTLAGEPGMQGRASAILAYRRAFSTMMSPNVLACYIAMALPAAIAFLEGAKGARKYAYAALCVLLLFALILTKSLGGLIAVSSALLVYLAARPGRFRLSGKKGAAAAMLAVLVIGGTALFIVQTRTDASRGIMRSLGQRGQYWSAAIDAAKDGPLTGYGAGSFQIVYSAHKLPEADETRYAHNIFLQSLVEAGPAGVLAMVALFGAFIFRGFRKARGKDDGLIFAGVLAGGTAFIVHNLIDFTWFVPETAILFWFYAGLIHHSDNLPEGRASWAGPGWRAVTAICLAVILFFFYKSYLASGRMQQALAVLSQAGITSSEAARSAPAPAEAVSAAEAALSLKPYDDGISSFLAGLYEGRAYADGPAAARKAEGLYRYSIRLNPKYPFYYRDLGLYYTKCGNPEAAKRAFYTAVSLYPSSPRLKAYLKDTENNRNK